MKDWMCLLGMNKRQKEKLEKKKLEKLNNEKIIMKDKSKKKKDEEKMTKEVKKYTPKFTKEQVLFIGELIDCGYGNNDILRLLKKEYGIERKSYSITHIRRAEHATFKEITDDRFFFARSGYPTYNEFQKILKGHTKPKTKFKQEVEENIEKIKEVPVVEKTTNNVEEKVEQVKEKMSNVQKDTETKEEYRDKEDIRNASTNKTDNDTIFNKIVRRILSLI